jgi:4-hydroxy-tetrahydrodipicolinate synthase
MEKIRHVGGRLAIYSGNDDTVIPLMALGAEGVISVVANALPEMMAQMTASYLAGDQRTALDLQLRLMPVICAFFSEVSPIPCKAAMEMMGLCGGDVRLPLVPISDCNRAKLREALISVGVNL